MTGLASLRPLASSGSASSSSRPDRLPDGPGARLDARGVGATLAAVPSAGAKKTSSSRSSVIEWKPCSTRAGTVKQRARLGREVLVAHAEAAAALHHEVDLLLAVRALLVLVAARAAGRGRRSAARCAAPRGSGAASGGAPRRGGRGRPACPRGRAPPPACAPRPPRAPASWCRARSRPTPAAAATRRGGCRCSRARAPPARSRRRTTSLPAARSSPRRRCARSPGSASRKNLTSASGNTAVPMSRPSSTTPPSFPISRWRATISTRTPGWTETSDEARLDLARARPRSVTS